MKKIEEVLKEVSTEKMFTTINWLVENTPYRLAGSSDEKEASEFVTRKMEEYGLEVENEEFFSYNSNPKYSKVEIISPIIKEIDSLPCAHIKSTKLEGEEFELVYVGDGSYDSYKDIDVKNKMVLVEVSYAPPVPEKARIAWENGASGIMCMNWGNDEKVICNRGLKAVWGNPTEETINKIPDIIGVGITRDDGLKLKKMCLEEGNIKVKIVANSSREWSKINQPKGILYGNGKYDEFLLVSAHLDAWKPGVTCNATGNATILEICRILSKYKDRLNRDIYFVFWNGHEIAEAAGSTWFVDNYWDLLNKKCVGYFNIDSTGVLDTSVYEIKASDELLEFSIRNTDTFSDIDEIRAMTLKKIGDQSFMGIGIPSVTQRMSFSQSDIINANGATLGWWNHTKEDSIDKCDLETLKLDTEVTLALIYKLAINDILPYNFDNKFTELIIALNKLESKFKEHLDFENMQKNLIRSQKLVMSIQREKSKISDENIEEYNKFVMTTSRLLSNIFQTYEDKYHQDSYGHTNLSYDIPLLADLDKLCLLNKETFEYGMVHTQIIKNINRINDALKLLIDFSELYKKVLINKQ